ncbi:MAG: hypothetical protein JWM97_2275 [Phycisphaerales bacterium]|nr:hypothetical protein [Phycisphaerales bacterium]
MLAAEVSLAQGASQITHAGEFTYPEGAGLQQPQALGAALAEFLKREGFTAHGAVFGIPAKWVLSKFKEVPPVAPETAAEMLRLQVEADFSPELKDLVYDFAGESSPSQARSVLLVATPQRHVDQARAIAEAAKLNLTAIIPTAAALASATTPAAKDALVLAFTGSAVEFIARHDGGTAALRHLGASSSPSAVLAGETRRAVMQLPRNGTAGSNGSSVNGNSRGEVVLWDDVGVDPSVHVALGEALGVTVKRGELRTLGAGEAPVGRRGYASAVALAMAGLAEEAPPVDFLHSRLAPPKKPKVRREVVLGIVTAVVIVLGVVAAYFDLQGKEKKLAAGQADLKSQEPRIKAARAEVDTISYAQNWHAGKPQSLECFRDIVKALSTPDDGHTYITNFTLHETVKPPPSGSKALPKADWSGVFSGKSTENQNVLSLLDRIKSNKRFTDVKLLFNTNVNRTGNEVSFSITFKYVPGE